jgi:hypothetical protein
MSGSTHTGPPAATVDVRELNTLRWGPIRQLLPAFAEEIELGRYLKRLLSEAKCRAVQLEPHRDPSGRPSSHVLDVFFIDESVRVG